MKNDFHQKFIHYCQHKFTGSYYFSKVASKEEVKKKNFSHKSAHKLSMEVVNLCELI